MKLLFIQGGSRVKEDKNGNYYTDGNFNKNVWDRYISLCDELNVILRKEKRKYDYDYACKKFSFFPTNLLNYIPVEDIYKPITNFFNFFLKRKIKKIIKSTVIKNDKVIIRSAASFYSNYAVKMCIKYKIPYLVEVTGFAFEGSWNHSLLGKIAAFSREKKVKKAVANADYVIYVTNDALQKRYVSKGKCLGCSDVFIENDGDKIRKNFINDSKIILGTAAFLDVKWKGQIEVIKALNELRKRGITNFEYHMAGLGNGKRLKKAVKKYGLEKVVIFDGALSNVEIKKWYENIDVYIQPSYQEGLCRSIVEAMSFGCPVLCSNVGGNYELVSNVCLFPPKNYKEIVNKLMIINKPFFLNESKRNYLFSRNYDRSILDIKRLEFLNEFISNKE